MKILNFFYSKKKKNYYTNCLNKQKINLKQCLKTLKPQKINT